jgi:hypothetical protein
MRRRHLSILLVFAALATVSGCIEAESAFYLRYDKEKDSFSQLRIFSNIRTSKAEELKYLVALTQMKEDAMILPIPGILGPPPAQVRLAGNKIHTLNLAMPPAGFKDKLEFPNPLPLPVDLAAIKIKPGKFFLNDDKNLCYSHEVEVPGKVVDQLILALNKEASKELPKGLDELIQMDGDDKLPKLTWELVRKKLSEQFSGDPKPEPKDGRLRGPFELASLQIMRKAAVDEKLALKRQGAKLTFHLPMTKTDAKEVVATFDHLRTEIDAGLDKELKKQEGMPNALDPKVFAILKGAIKQGFKYKLDASGGVAFELDLTTVIMVANLLNKETERMPHPEFGEAAKKKYEAACQAAQMALKDGGIEILPMLDGKKLRAPYVSAK